MGSPFLVGSTLPLGSTSWGFVFSTLSLCTAGCSLVVSFSGGRSGSCLIFCGSFTGFGVGLLGSSVPKVAMSREHTYRLRIHNFCSGTKKLPSMNFRKNRITIAPSRALVKRKNHIVTSLVQTPQNVCLPRPELLE